MERYEKIKEHIKSESSLTKLYRYGSRRNNASWYFYKYFEEKCKESGIK